MKDTRYIAVKALIETGRITTFADIFEYIPRKTVYIDLGINYTRFTKLIEHPGGLTITEIKTLSGLFEIEVIQAPGWPPRKATR